MPPCHYTYPCEPSRCHTPFAHHQQQPASDQMITSYRLFVADPAVVRTVYHEVDEDSPLDLVYHATIQALWLEELSHYVNHQNPLLSPARTILNEIATQQVPLSLRLFDVLGGTDLIYNSHDSLSEVDPETAFGISHAELDYMLNIVETLAQLLPSPRAMSAATSAIFISTVDYMNVPFAMPLALDILKPSAPLFALIVLYRTELLPPPW
ncbi:hypothetical protein M404DRAFT_24421 [Pisolithus tinctorius Marx 270]|uniref:Uncharacterized protein n=1 Tax=Pisolithus tinctorius Marx 270 TaxID=870435 RepID=A0A0C3KAV0_PISTI|nr:hypothetical protein M404DRAFT_24421 [Pisolithus tinctorius Marx 270]